MVPYPFKILNSNGMIVILYEALHSYRQIFLDGRPLPKDPNPTWMGYSVGHWDGDTLVVESKGLSIIIGSTIAAIQEPKHCI